MLILLFKLNTGSLKVGVNSNAFSEIPYVSNITLRLGMEQHATRLNILHESWWWKQSKFKFINEHWTNCLHGAVVSSRTAVVPCAGCSRRSGVAFRWPLHHFRVSLYEQTEGYMQSYIGIVHYTVIVHIYNIYVHISIIDIVEYIVHRYSPRTDCPQITYSYNVAYASKGNNN